MNFIEVFKNQAGALPIKNTIDVGNVNSMIMFASGSAFSSTPSLMECEILLDGLVVATLKGFTNEVSSHKALVPIFLELSGFDAPIANFEIRAKNSNTLTDFNDYFNLSVLIVS